MFIGIGLKKNDNQCFNYPPPVSLRSSKAVLCVPSKGGVQKIQDFLPTVNHIKWGIFIYSFNQNLDWGTIPPWEGDKGGG